MLENAFCNSWHYYHPHFLYKSNYSKKDTITTYEPRVPIEYSDSKEVRVLYYSFVLDLIAVAVILFPPQNYKQS